MRVATYDSKVPAKSRAPTMVLSLGKPAIAVRSVLLAIRNPPPMVVRLGKVRLAKLGLSTKAKVPPVWVKLGAEKLSKLSE